MANEFLPVFRPSNTVSIAATTGTATVALSGSGDNVRASNSGLTAGFVTFGGASVTGTVSTGMPIQPGTSEVFAISPTYTHAAVITESGTSRISLTRGTGG